LRALRLGEIIFNFFSRKGATDAKKIKRYSINPKKPLRALRLGEIIFNFFSRKGATDARKSKGYYF
jgi:hypothetical protein